MKKSFYLFEQPTGMPDSTQAIVILKNNGESKSFASCPQHQRYFGVDVTRAEALIEPDSKEQIILDEVSFDNLFTAVKDGVNVSTSLVEDFLEKNKQQ